MSTISFLILFLVRLSLMGLGGPQLVHANRYAQRDWGLCPFGSCAGHIGCAQTEYDKTTGQWIGNGYCWGKSLIGKNKLP